MTNIVLQISQIIFAVLLVVFILLQQRGTALGSVFGGGGESYFKKRGMEKTFFRATIILAVLFVLNTLLNLLL